MAQHVVERITRSRRLAIVADLDGTLVPLGASPDAVRPDPETLFLLQELAALRGVTVTIASGRPRSGMADLLPLAGSIDLLAEDGVWRRDGASWRTLPSQPAHGPSWRGSALRAVGEALDLLCQQFPGALVEQKTLAVTLHLRLVEQPSKADLIRTAGELIDGLVLRHPELVRLDGQEVIEVRARAAHKGLVVAHARRRTGRGSSVLALGDDLSDEAMFAALGPRDLGVLVSARRRRSSATTRVATVHGVLRLLRRVVRLRKA